MGTISIIAAMSSNRVIGINNELPWELPSDLKRFKSLTIGHSVIMGRRTWDSLPERFRPLPRRENVVVSKNIGLTIGGARRFFELEHAFDYVEQGEDEAFVIGGESIFHQALVTGRVKKIYLTTVDIVCPGDAFFPEINPVRWRVAEMSPRQQEANDQYPFFFETLVGR